jgi:nucleoside-diphosphate-sugar epimerase
MVIGNGLMAQTFSSYEKNESILIFASGVSNSTEIDDREFQRETELLKQTILKYPSYTIVYFSTCSIDDPTVRDRPYIKHKLRLEQYIKKRASNYLILRVSNVVGDLGNPHTILNFLHDAIDEGVKIEVWSQARRNIIDKADCLYIVEELLKKNEKNKTINIASRESVLVTDIVKQIELFLQKKVNGVFIDKGIELDIDVSDINEELVTLDLRNGKGNEYIYTLLKKYY